MAKIHGLAYVFVGLGVAIQAYFIDYEKLFIFFWIGLAMVAYGVGKLVLSYIMHDGKEDKPKPAAPVAMQHPIQRPAAPGLRPAMQPVRPAQPTAKAPVQQIHQKHIEFCPYCGTPVLPHHAFCGKCGKKIE